MPFKSLLCSAALLLLGWVSPLSAASSGSAKLKAPPPTGNRYLFIVENSSTMEKRDESTRQTMFEFVNSGLRGRMLPGDTFGVWAFNSTPETRFPMQVWDSSTRLDLATRVNLFLRDLGYRKRGNFERVWRDLQVVIASVNELTVVLLTDGNDRITGTPFDQEINATYRKLGNELSAKKQPFITAFALREGQFIAYSVTRPEETIVLPPPTEKPRPAAAPLARTEDLPRSVSAPVLTTNPPPRRVPAIVVTKDSIARDNDPIGPSHPATSAPAAAPTAPSVPPPAPLPAPPVSTTAAVALTPSPSAPAAAPPTISRSVPSSPTTVVSQPVSIAAPPPAATPATISHPEPTADGSTVAPRASATSPPAAPAGAEQAPSRPTIQVTVPPSLSTIPVRVEERVPAPSNLAGNSPLPPVHAETSAGGLPVAPAPPTERIPPAATATAPPPHPAPASVPAPTAIVPTGANATGATLPSATAAPGTLKVQARALTGTATASPVLPGPTPTVAVAPTLPHEAGGMGATTKLLLASVMLLGAIGCFWVHQQRSRRGKQTSFISRALPRSTPSTPAPKR